MSKSKSYKDNGDKPERFAPVAIDSSANARAVDEAEQIEIFSIDGRSYTMPGVERSDIALTYLELMENEGEDAAAYYLLAETIGAEGYKALRSVKGLTSKQFEGVLTRVRSIALPKGSGAKRRKG